jgi:hypothetical protein
LSIIEFGVYGLITYASLLVLVLSILKENPVTKSGSIIRSIYMIPGIITAGLLMTAGPNIILEDVNTYSNVTSLTSPPTTFIENVTINTTFVLQNPVWVIFHFFILAILLVYVIVQILALLTAKT